MIDFNFQKFCYSCGACGNSCPVGAISFDEELYPVVDVEKCIRCGLCQNVCIHLNQRQPVRRIWPEWGYVLKNQDDAQRKDSSSGGVFIQLAQAVLADDGYVCGCVYDDHQLPQHVVAKDLDTCKKMMGSKYIKSDVRCCISEVKNLVRKGHKVLFTGVPCQIAAVKACVKSENLLTAAVVCHGSIERDVWRRFLAEEAPEGEIAAVTMRDKSKGYLNYGLKFIFRDGTERITYRNIDGYFLKSFTDGLLERDRCLTCVYKEHKIESDILLGDAWGMDRIFPDFTDEMGCSAVLTLTAAGEALIQGVLEKFHVKTLDSTTLINSNQRILTPAPVNPFRDSFRRKLEKESTNIHQLTKQYAQVTLINRVKWKLAKIFCR